jgi:hypothetical protein
MKFGIRNLEIPSECRNPLILENSGLIDGATAYAKRRDLGVPLLALVLTGAISHGQGIIPEQLVESLDVVSRQCALIRREGRDKLRQYLRDIYFEHNVLTPRSKPGSGCSNRPSAWSAACIAAGLLAPAQSVTRMYANNVAPVRSTS